MNPTTTLNRAEALEAAIARHREEKAGIPACTCWLTVTQKLDKALYASLDEAVGPEGRVAQLEAAIRLNREGKKGLPDCPCWANAPQIVDAELFKILDVRVT